MAHEHSHNHLHEKGHMSESRIVITMLLNFLITIAEAVGGFISGSLSLISDSMHNFSDGVAMIITYIALRLSKKPGTTKYTFGLKRAEILAAVINSCTLIIISVFLIIEAFERLRNPASVSGGLMLTVSLAGLAANAIGTFLLKKGSHENINIRAAYFHLLSDAVSSVAVIVGAIFIIFYKNYWIDPFLTILISLYILHEAYSIVKESVDIIMMSSPQEIDLNELKSLVENIPGVKNIHHVHLWKLNDSNTHFEAHVDVCNITVSETAVIQNEIQERLHNKFEITHTTLQFECGTCDETELIKNGKK
jgi:cobalt-zinc-cadmium efflux system protein